MDIIIFSFLLNVFAYKFFVFIWLFIPCLYIYIGCAINFKFNVSYLYHYCGNFHKSLS